MKGTHACQSTLPGYCLDTGLGGAQHLGQPCVTGLQSARLTHTDFPSPTSPRPTLTPPPSPLASPPCSPCQPPFPVRGRMLMSPVHMAATAGARAATTTSPGPCTEGLALKLDRKCMLKESRSPYYPENIASLFQTSPSVLLPALVVASLRLELNDVALALCS